MIYILRAKKPQKLKCNAKLVYKNKVHVYCEISLFKHINLRYFNMIKYDNLNVSNQIWCIKDYSFAILKVYYAYFKPKKKTKQTILLIMQSIQQWNIKRFFTHIV